MRPDRATLGTMERGALVESRGDGRRSNAAVRYAPLVVGTVCGIATFVNFLIFAQFGYLERLRHLGFGSEEIRVFLGLMGVSGLVTSLLAPLLFR